MTQDSFRSLMTDFNNISSHKRQLRIYLAFKGTDFELKNGDFNQCKTN